ncbi:MAG: hypothetical protein ACREQJ_16720 [Candidatus Binatia bacterium]
MAATPDFSDYLKAAFNARPAGMLVPPNWLGVAAFGLLGALANPGFLAIGAGLELAYLAGLVGNRRFRATVDARASRSRIDHSDARKKIESLPRGARERFEALRARCARILEIHSTGGVGDEALGMQQMRSLEKFAWIFFQLLVARETILALGEESRLSPKFREALDEERQQLEKRIASPQISPDLKKSLEGRLAIVVQRLAVLAEAREKLAYVEAELTRVEHQVELLREQAALTSDARALSARIDSVGSSLGETSKWIEEQRSVFGSSLDVGEDPPPRLLADRVAN